MDGLEEQRRKEHKLASQLGEYEDQWVGVKDYAVIASGANFKEVRDKTRHIEGCTVFKVRLKDAIYL